MIELNKKKFTSKKRVAIMATFLGILSLSILGYFGYGYYSEYQIKSVAIKYLNLTDISTSPNDLDKNLKDISTKDFINRNLQSITKSFSVERKINATVDKILFVDRRKAALEAVVYYTAHPSNESHSTPAQLNLVLYKEVTGWKVQDAYFMGRTDRPIPENSEIERANQIQRYSYFSDLVKQLLQSRMDGDLTLFTSLFSEETSNAKYINLFTDEQEYLNKNDLKLTLISSGLLINSSTDLEALTTLLLNQSTDKEIKSISPMKIKFVYEKGKWMISDIYSWE